MYASYSRNALSEQQSQACLHGLRPGNFDTKGAPCNSRPMAEKVDKFIAKVE